MNALPVWSIILLCLPVVLWFVYCVMTFTHADECNGACLVTFALIGLALVGYGLYSGDGAFVGVGALILFFILLTFGGYILVEHLDRKRQAEKAAAESRKE
jgi:hypothetical protein